MKTYSLLLRMAAMISGLRRPCRTATTHSGLFIRRVANQVIAHANEAQRSCGEVGAAVAAIGEGNDSANSVENFVNHPVGGVRVVLSNVAA